MKTAYDILGVPRHADDKAIRAAYRRAAKVHHPDLNAGDKVAEQSFRQLAAAYEVLKDPQQRDAYDVSLRKRRFGKTASVVAGLICGAGLAAMLLLSKTLGPLPQPQLRHVVLTKATEPRDVAALDDVGRQQTGVNERVVSGAATSAELHEDQPRHIEQLANKEETSAAGLDVAMPLASITSQLKQEPVKRDTMQFWVSVVRNPEAFQDKPGRSELLQAIDTGDDARLLRALSMAADGPIAERARRRLTHLSKAIMMLDAEDGEGAGSLGSKAEATPSSDAAFYLTRSGLHLRRGNFDQAITDCDEAIRLEPGKAHAYGQRGKAWAGMGDTDRALADYDAAIHLDPHNANLLREQGVLWRQLGDLDRALASFDQAIRLGFSDAIAYNERGQVWLQKGRYERAIADFNQALKVNPDLVGALINRGIAWRTKGALDRAIADFGQVISIDPNLPAAYYNRGLARSQKQDVELAMADFTKAWELLPSTWSPLDPQ